MGRITRAIKRAAAAVQFVATPHDVPTVPEENEIGKVMPAEVTDEQELAEARTNALKVIRQLEESAPSIEEQAYGLSDQMKARITYNLHRLFGPPRDMFTHVNFPRRKIDEKEMPMRSSVGIEPLSQFKDVDVSPIPERLKKDAEKAARIAERHDS